MTKKRAISLIVGASLVIVLVALRLILPAVLPAAQGQLAKFMTMFLAILLAFIFFGVYLASMLFSGKISRRAYTIVEAIIIAGIVIGGLGMFQPWLRLGYTAGFNVLLASTLAFTVWSHVKPKST